MEDPSEVELPVSQSPARQTGMPRRFGVGTLLSLTTFFAVLCAGLSSLQAPPPVFGATGLFLTAIVLGQMLLFGGQRPREASILVGAAMAELLMGALLVAFLLGGGPSHDSPVPLVIVFVPAVGALLGYVVGSAFGGMLLVIELWKRRCARSSSLPPGEG